MNGESDMTDNYKKGIAVMDYLKSIGLDMETILDAICDENLEKSYEIITRNPTITKYEFVEQLGIEYDEEEIREEFFLEPSQSEKDFYSFIDNALEKATATDLIEFTCEPLNSSKANVNFIGFSVFLREVPEQEIFIETENYRGSIRL